MSMTASLMTELPDGERTTLMDRAVPRSLEPGEILHLAGDRCDRVHFVTEGVIKLSLRDSNGEETILGLGVPGSILGDMPAADHRSHPLDAIAATRSEVLGFDPQLFVEVVFRNPRAALALARSSSARCRWVIDTALERTSGEVPARLAGRLLDLGRMLGRANGTAIELELPLGQRELGKLAGMCRESTCKTLRRFKAAGLVDYEGRRLRILRPDSLQMMRCGSGD